MMRGDRRRQRGVAALALAPPVMHEMWLMTSLWTQTYKGVRLSLDFSFTIAPCMSDLD